MIVAIDGPAGAGKSSVSRRLAERLGFHFLDTGAMYRAVALSALRSGLTKRDDEAIALLADNMSLEMTDDTVLLDGEDITRAIRTSEVSAAVHLAADNPRVRSRLVELQRELGSVQDLVTEGRDQATIAFPHAECKIFLTATPLERARRRHQELSARGESITLDEVLAAQNERDLRDSSREVGRLELADDATEFYTDGLSTEQVVERLEAIVRQVQTQLSSGRR